MTVGATLRHLIGYVSPYRGKLALLMVTILVEVTYETSLPLTLRFIIDRVIAPRDWELLSIIVVVLVAGFAATMTAMVSRDYLYAWLTSHALTDIRLAMFRHLQRLPLGFYARSTTGDLVARFSTDLAAVESALVLGAPSALLSVVYLVASSGALIYLDWRLALVVLAGMPMVLIGPRLFGGKALQLGRAVRVQQASLTNLVQENIGAQPVVKAFNLGDSAVRGFRTEATRLQGVSVRFGFLSYLTERSPNMGMAAFSLTVLLAGAFLVMTDHLTVGSLISFYALFGNVTSSVLTVTSIAPTLLQAASGMHRIQEVLGAKGNADDGVVARVLPPFAREIAFRGVTFTYTGERTNLADVSFSIRRGERVAFVGPSGCGKSTALNLILRFYEPNQGSVLLDETDIRDVQRGSLYAQIGVVFQDNFMFNDTIRENIRIGRPEATDAEVEDAARGAELHDFIVAKLPRGYDTPMGERGGALSGGQRQRVAIARALLRNPALLILDEATSALDPETEAAINQTLTRVAGGRTVIAVTHRLASVADFDRVFVFDDGRLVERGSFDELIAARGRFAQLWAKQSGVSVSGGSAQVHAEWLRTVDLFAGMDPAQLERLAEEFQTERVDAGHAVITQGEVGDRFYILVRGKAEVLMQGATDDHQRRIGVLDDGDYFGEVALLEDAPRMATVRTLEPCILLSLHHDKFARLVDRTPGLREALALAHHARANATNLSAIH